jgi:hypothetical protein
MKQLYIKKIITTTFILLFFLSCYQVTAQCPYGGTPGTTAFDTTIKVGPGILTTQLKFAKFDPQAGMVTCVRLCVTIKGIIDTVAIENYTSGAQTANYTYQRRDTIRGPGIPTYLASPPINLTFGPYPLDPFDGIYDSGPDLYTRGSDTVTTQILCINISDSLSIVPFYGAPGDSVAYDYTINASATGVIPGGSGQAMVRSSAVVNFHFEYCTCPAVVLPLNIRNLLVNKIADNKAAISWSGVVEENASYRYVVEVSRDGYNFSDAGEVARNIKEEYKYIYASSQNEKGVFFFRVKQVYATGQILYSDIKQVYLENSPTPKFTAFPNPSTGIVGIKFDNIESGKMMLQVYNSRGQKVMQKDILVTGSSYQQVGMLESGIYWLRLTNEKNRLSYVSQLLIK